MARAGDHCAACVFYVEGAKPPEHVVLRSAVDTRGSCRRYPASLVKAPADWCGEFKQRRN